jgi:hypothetical protein
MPFEKSGRLFQLFEFLDAKHPVDIQQKFTLFPKKGINKDR